MEWRVSAASGGLWPASRPTQIRPSTSGVWGAESSRAPGFDISAAAFGCITGDDAGRGTSQGARVDATLLLLVYESTRNITSRSERSNAVMQVEVFGVIDLEFIRVVMRLFRVQPVCAEVGRFL